PGRRSRGTGGSADPGRISGSAGGPSTRAAGGGPARRAKPDGLPARPLHAREVLKNFARYRFERARVAWVTPPSSSRTVSVTVNEPPGRCPCTTAAVTSNGAVPPWLWGGSG